MPRQTKYPPIFSVFLALIRKSDAKIYLSDLVDYNDAHEFPRCLYSDVLCVPLIGSLEERPTEAERFECARQKLLELVPQSQFGAHLENLLDLGLYESPNWGNCMHYLKYYMLAIIDDTSSFKGIENYRWQCVDEVLSDWNEDKMRLSPPTLGLMRCLHFDMPNKGVMPLLGSGSHTHRFWHAVAHETSAEQWGALTHLEYSPKLECIPILSDTLSPFHATNMVVVDSGDELLIVDPGANTKGENQLESVLARFSPRTAIHVFLTHHHHDHVDALPLIEKIYPEAVIVGHPYTLKKLKRSSLKTIAVCEDDQDQVYRFGGSSRQSSSSIPQGSYLRTSATTNRRSLVREIMVLSLPGHTRGHLALWDQTTRTLIAGDHVVGVGSSVLDPDGGGDMKAYLDSTHRLLELGEIQVILPCHGPPTLTHTRELLQNYIKHRNDREKAISYAWLSLNIRTLPALVAHVYADTPSNLFAAAQLHVLLHLEKLQNDGVLQVTTEIQALIHEHHDPDALPLPPPCGKIPSTI